MTNTEIGPEDIQDIDEVNFGDVDEDDGDIPEPPQPPAVITTTAIVRSEIIDSSIIKANIKAQDEALTALTDYVNSKLIPGKDYFAVTEGQLPSLGKPGAEKINFIFRLVPKYKILSKTFRATEITYELQCDLVNKITGEFSGSGVGACTSLEDKWCYLWKFEKDVPEHINIKDLEYKEFFSQNMNQGRGGYYRKYRIPIDNHYNLANNMLKMAKKRAYVDATLSATMASFLFTQDIEERQEEYLIGPAKPKKTTSGSPRTGAAPKADQTTTKPPQQAPRPVQATPAATQPQQQTQPQQSSGLNKQWLNCNTFKILNKNSQYYGKTLVECPSWYLQGQIDWIEQGKFDPAKYGYERQAYIDMYRLAIKIRKAEHEKEEQGEL